MEETAAGPQPKSESIFTVDLEDNGGQFSPSSYAELTQRLTAEQQFWSWAMQRQHGGHEIGFREALGDLNNAINSANQWQQQLRQNSASAGAQLDACKNYVEQAFKRRKLPHSSTPIAKRIAAYQQKEGSEAASFMLGVFVPPSQGQPFQPGGLNAWRGMFEGVLDRFNFGTAIAKARKQASEAAFEELRAKAQQLVDEKAVAYDALHRDYARLATDVTKTAAEQAVAFVASQDERGEAFNTLVDEHKSGMEALRTTFREELGLRAPADYWETKRAHHARRARITGLLSFGGIVTAATLLGMQVHDLLAMTQPNQPPESWRLAVLVLIGLFAVWGVRLVVRIFLSHVHLTTDAAERVVMVKTYLSLTEGKQLESKEDRQLILQALFRPASDGLVKDEGIPPSFIELLSRSPRT